MVDPNHVTPVTKATVLEWYKSAGIFIAASLLVYFVYWYSDRFESVVSYVDILTTGFFFVGMYLLALRKIENLLVLLVGNIISVPLYFYKGYSFSAILYFILIIMAIIGYYQWKKYLNKPILAD